jgi:adenosylcobinamide-GDP ribazoletransferase
MSSLVTFLAALQFLTIAPAFIRRVFTPQELGRAVGFYPMVGLILGAILAGSNNLLSLIFPTPVTAALLLTLWVLLTGVLHLDGFLDTCDGIFGGNTPEKRLEIMRDERVGAYGLAGGVLLIITKYTALSAQQDPTFALLLAPSLSRWGMTLAIVGFPYARSQGLGRDIKDQTSWRQVLLATIIALAVAWFTYQWIGLIALVSTGLVIWLGARFILQRLPGLTGDIYGAFNEIAELVILLLLLVKQSL